MQQISSQLMSGLSSSQEPLCEDPLQAMFHHFASICRGFAWANFEVLWSLKSVIPHCPELEVHHTNGSGVLLCHSSHSPLMCCEVWWLPPPPQCLAAEGVYDPVRIHPTQAVGQHLSLHWKFWISGSLLMITSLSPSTPPPFGKGCISTPVVSDDKAPIKGPRVKVSSAFVSNDAACYSESTLLTFCS